MKFQLCLAINVCLLISSCWALELSRFRRDNSNDSQENAANGDDDLGSFFQSGFESYLNPFKSVPKMMQESQVKLLSFTEGLLEQSASMLDNIAGSVEEQRNSTSEHKRNLKRGLKFLKQQARRLREDIEDDIEIEQERIANDKKAKMDDKSDEPLRQPEESTTEMLKTEASQVELAANVIPAEKSTPAESNDSKMDTKQDEAEPETKRLKKSTAADLDTEIKTDETTSATTTTTTTGAPEIEITNGTISDAKIEELAGMNLSTIIRSITDKNDDNEPLRQPEESTTEVLKTEASLVELITNVIPVEKSTPDESSDPNMDTKDEDEAESETKRLKKSTDPEIKTVTTTSATTTTTTGAPEIEITNGTISDAKIEELAGMNLSTIIQSITRTKDNDDDEPIKLNHTLKGLADGFGQHTQ